MSGAREKLRSLKRTSAKALRPWRLRVREAVRRGTGQAPVVLLINDCRDQENYGAEILVDAIDPIIQQALPRHQIDYIPSAWLLDAAHGFADFKKEADIRQPDARWPYVADHFEPVADLWENGRGGPGAKEFLAKMERADVVVLNGEGSVYRDNLSAVRELYLAWFAKTRLRKPTVFLNGLVHLSNIVPRINAMVAKTFRALDAVAVRDPVSLRNLHSYYPEIGAVMIPDSCFYLAHELGQCGEIPAPVRARLAGQSYFTIDPGPMPLDYQYGERSAIHELVVKLKRLTGQAVFVESAPTDSYMEKVCQATGSIYVSGMRSYRDFAGLLSGARFQVTGRYHNPLIASMVGTPSISFATSSHKVHGSCEVLEGINGSPFDGTNLREQMDAILDRARLYLADRGEIRRRLRTLALRHRETTAELGAILTRVAARSR